MYRELNKRFLGRDESDNIENLHKQYEAAMNSLIELRRKINNHRQSSRCFLGEEDIKGLCSRWPSLEFTKTNDGYVQLRTMRTPISFYTERWDDDAQYVYTTYPLYSFTAKFSGRRPDIRSVDDTYGHPHAQCDGRRFASICADSNEFLHIYENPRITRDQLIFMLDSMMLWFTTTNLNDMYGTRLSNEAPNLHQKVMEWHDESEELFAMAQLREKEKLHKRLVEINASSFDMSPEEMSTADYINDFIFAYALWLKHHNEVLSGCLVKDCFKGAIDNDIAQYMHLTRPTRYKPLSNIHDRILAGPKKLSRYIRHLHRRDQERIPESLKQIIE